MITERLTFTNRQAQSGTSTIRLTSQNELFSCLEEFELDCKVGYLSPATIRYYDNSIKRFFLFLTTVGISEIAQIEKKDICAFLADLQKTNTACSVADYFRAIRRFFNWMKREKKILESPMSELSLPKVPKKVISVFQREDVLRLLDLCTLNRFSDARNKAIIMVFMDTGIRRRELADMMVDDIDFKHGVFKVMGKGAKERILRISLPTQKALRDYLKRRTDSLPNLWITEWGQPILPDGITLMLHNMGRRAGLHGVRCSPHTFRHTCGTNAIRNGATPLEVKSLLGHETLYMTDHYTATLASEYAAERHKAWSPVERWKLK
jgi:site-specific recombinase XerD